MSTRGTGPIARDGWPGTNARPDNLSSSAKPCSFILIDISQEDGVQERSGCEFGMGGQHYFVSSVGVGDGGDAGLRLRQRRSNGSVRAITCRQ